MRTVHRSHLIAFAAVWVAAIATFCAEADRWSPFHAEGDGVNDVTKALISAID